MAQILKITFMVDAPQDRLSSVRNLQCQVGQLLQVVSVPSRPVVIDTKSNDHINCTA